MRTPSRFAHSLALSILAFACGPKVSSPPEEPAWARVRPQSSAVSSGAPKTEVEPEKAGDISGQFPQTVAGFTFGMTPEEGLALCFDAMRREHGDAMVQGAPEDYRSRFQSDGTAACISLPKDPFFQAGTIAILHFCGASLCEVIVRFKTVLALDPVREQLTQKYGPPIPLEPMPATRCTGHDEARLAWYSSKNERLGIQAGAVRLLVECADTERTLSVYYMDEAGMRYRLAQAAERDANY